MKQKEIIKKLQESAKKYKENLQNRNVLILYEENGKIKYIEILFLARNFMHLTGTKSNSKKANQFYVACLNNKLSYQDIKIKKDGTTQLKLEILFQIMNMDKKCKMIGIYNNAKEKLSTELVIGNITMCLGLIKELSNYYIPNTILKEDIRTLTIKTYPIIGILKKKIIEPKYKTITYINKRINISDIEKIKELRNKISLKDIIKMK